MRDLYSGELRSDYAAEALLELDKISRELAEFPSSRVVWDIKDRTKTPPWGDNIADTITDLSNYFVTSTGRDLIQVMREVLEDLRDSGGVLKVVSY